MIMKRLMLILLILSLGTTQAGNDEAEGPSGAYQDYREKATLAGALVKSGDFERAETLYLEVIDYWQDQGGMGAFPPLMSLSLLYSKQERWAEAAKIQVQIIELLDADGSSTPKQMADHHQRLRDFRELAGSVKKIKHYQELLGAQGPADKLTKEEIFVRYAANDPPPQSFDLVAKTNAEGKYVVNNQALSLDGLIQLIAEQQAATVLVEDDRSLGSGELCLAVIGIETGAMLYDRYDGKTTSLRLSISQDIYSEIASTCHHPEDGNE